MPLRRHAVVALLLAALGGCDPFGELSEAFQKSGRIAAALKAALGADAFVGFKIHNGTLTEVNVVLGGAAIRERPVSETAAAVRRLVHEHFGQAPERLLLSYEIGGG